MLQMVDLLKTLVQGMGFDLPESAKRGAAGVGAATAQANTALGTLEPAAAQAGGAVEDTFVQLSDSVIDTMELSRSAFEEAMAAMTDQADAGFGGIFDSIQTLDGREIRIPVIFDQQGNPMGNGGGGNPGGYQNIASMASGGIADVPQLAMIGDAPSGPEVVAPVRALFGSLGDMIGRQVATRVRQALQGSMMGGGRGGSSGGGDIIMDGDRVGRVLERRAEFGRFTVPSTAVRSRRG